MSQSGDHSINHQVQAGILRGVHQTEHLSTGFIGEPTGHEKASANSGIFESPALTRTRDGACWSVRTLRRCAFSPVLEHHT